MNKDKAMQMLKAKLYLMKQQEQADKVSGIRGEIKEIGFGSQIRSYVMQPYTLVKDHRTNMEISNVNGVLDGSVPGTKPLRITTQPVRIGSSAPAPTGPGC